MFCRLRDVFPIPAYFKAIVHTSWPLPHPEGTLKLLQSAIGVEKISSVLKEEGLRQEQLLLQYKNWLEGEVRGIWRWEEC